MERHGRRGLKLNLSACRNSLRLSHSLSESALKKHRLSLLGRHVSRNGYFRCWQFPFRPLSRNRVTLSGFLKKFSSKKKLQASLKESVTILPAELRSREIVLVEPNEHLNLILSIFNFGIVLLKIFFLFISWK